MPVLFSVAGWNFGDEGKGLMVDYLTGILQSRAPGRNLVIRHNGGAQAGHTVVRNGHRHVFGHMGSGTFAGAPTYLERQFIVNPFVFYKEYKALEALGYKPTVIAHPECKVTTQYDVILNHLREFNRDGSRHGSCGVGIYETLRRNIIVNGDVIDVNQLFNGPFMKQKLDRVRDYFYAEVEKEGLDIPEEYQKILAMDLYGTFQNLREFFMDHADMKRPDLIYPNYDNLVFEGAQGLLLTQENKEYYPHLTPSSTGITNVNDAVYEAGLKISEAHLHYVTRPYMTRHGAGKFESEMDISSYVDLKDPTNIPNQFQGTLRSGYLDVDLMIQHLRIDINRINPAMLPNHLVNLVMTCVDQLKNDRQVYAKMNGMAKTYSLREIFEYIRMKVKGAIFVYESHGPSASDVRSAS